ncbi:MAG TPA: hypothetical protein VGE59_04430 [Patescibacteria group bacterium]
MNNSIVAGFTRQQFSWILMFFEGGGVFTAVLWNPQANQVFITSSETPLRVVTVSTNKEHYLRHL